jgi:Ser-tRNA(Ala) deacylase AlaX
MANTEKLKKYEILKEILETNHAAGTSIKRKVLIGEAIDAGLVEKDVYIIIGKKFRSDVHAGHYVRDLMLDKLNSKLNVVSSKNVATKPSYSTPVVEKSDYAEEASDWVLPYGEDDIADELSLMGTYL